MTHNKKLSIQGMRHPHFSRDLMQWELWRDTYEGGDYYLRKYLKKFSDRETDAEFLLRRELTPIPTFAKSALLDIRNSIYQRLVEVTRTGGSNNYQNAICGIGGGVDGLGSTMDAFIGNDVLTELLMMGRVGCYIDASPNQGLTLADPTYPPYLTYYRVEDIVNLVTANRGEGGEFQAVLLADHNVTAETAFSGISLPTSMRTQYRLVWRDQLDGMVYYKILDENQQVILQPESFDDGRVATGLSRVPFVMFDIGDSVLKDVASYQRALLNLGSSDVYYAIRSNSSFLTIQEDGFATGTHLKRPETAEGVTDAEELGGGKGRYYGPNMDRPQFIAPPTEPLQASMLLQDRLQDAIRELVNLAVTNKAGSRTESAEAKKIGTQGLENGLAFIGMVLERGEKQITSLWAEYEDTLNPRPGTVHYPDRYVLKDDMQRMEEADKMAKLAQKLPGKELKKTVTRQIVVTLLGGKTPKEEIDKILTEVDNGNYLISEPSEVFEAHKEGFVSTVTGSNQLGYNGEKEVEQAKKDRVERAVAVLAAQTSPDDRGPKNPASRGVPELDTDPNSGATEKEDDEE